MNQNRILVINSLLTMLFATFHLADDITRGMAPGRLTNLNVVLVLAVWLYATLVLAERRSGHIIILLLSLLSSGIPVVHMIGRRGITAGIAPSGGAFFFVFTLLALGAVAVLTVLLSLRGLWILWRGEPK